MSAHLIDTATGGLIALAGTFLAQWFGLFSSKVERRQKHAALQRERLEKISECIGEGVEWYQTVLTLKSFESVRDTHVVKQIRQATMMAQIHFSDSDSGLAELAKEYSNSLNQYKAFALSSFRQDAPPGATIGAQMVLNPKMQEYVDKQLALRNKLDDAIAKEARKYEPSA